ncbi:24706_t:CDS:2 [Cetraspora pellucida]|uniref:24706_t:CDS:1 n=1 Tax=Cetraspora pellucida TaxID=1433469 RepID=A0A9N8WFW2_9GLOM|nr:24706_t:CDS:2 [Cetraspora pellucida]
MGTKNNINKPPPRNLQKEGRIKKRTLSSIFRKNGILKPNQLVIHGKDLSKKKQKKIERRELRRRVEQGEMVPEKLINAGECLIIVFFRAILFRLSNNNKIFIKDMPSNADSQQTIEMDIVSLGSGTILGAPSFKPDQINMDND